MESNLSTKSELEKDVRLIVKNMIGFSFKTMKNSGQK